MTVHGQLLVGADVKQPAGGVVAARGESVPVGEERHGVDVRLVAGERLLAQPLPDVPQLGGGVASSCREKGLLGFDRLIFYLNLSKKYLKSTLKLQFIHVEDSKFQIFIDL